MAEQTARHGMEKTWIDDKVIGGKRFTRARFARCICGFTASYLSDDGSAECDVYMHAARLNKEA